MRTRRTRRSRKKNGKQTAILAAIALSLGALTVLGTRRQPQADTADHLRKYGIVYHAAYQAGQEKRDQEKYSEQLCRFQLLQQNETAQTGY